LDSGTVNDGNWSATATLTTEGRHSYYVTAYDFAGSSASSATYTYSYDPNSPVITLVSPTTSSFTNSSTVIFNWTVTDLDPTLECNLTINGVVNQSSIASANGTTANYTVFGFADGIYRWNVTCWDDYNNKNTSATWNVTVDTTPPVVAINSPSTDEILNNRTITVNLTVTEQNINYTDVLVRGVSSAVDNYVWVTNYNSNSVSKIDKATGTVVAEIPVGSTPFGIAVDDRHVWAVNRYSNSISEIDDCKLIS